MGVLRFFYRSIAQSLIRFQGIQARKKKNQAPAQGAKIIAMRVLICTCLFVLTRGARRETHVIGWAHKTKAGSGNGHKKRQFEIAMDKARELVISYKEGKHFTIDTSGDYLEFGPIFRSEKKFVVNGIKLTEKLGKTTYELRFKSDDEYNTFLCGFAAAFHNLGKGNDPQIEHMTTQVFLRLETKSVTSLIKGSFLTSTSNQEMKDGLESFLDSQVRRYIRQEDGPEKEQLEEDLDSIPTAWWRGSEPFDMFHTYVEKKDERYAAALEAGTESR